MTNQVNSHVQPEVLKENKVTIHSFLKDSYNQVKKQIDDGVAAIEDGVSFLKNEFHAAYDRTGDFINRMTLPVNNFIKDIGQIETELKHEVSSSPEQLICLHGTMVPVDQVLASPMEENY